MTVFSKLESGIRAVVVPAYSDLSGLSSAYAQGSLVEGLAEEADLDLVLVWNSLPSPNRRPPAGLADSEPAPQVFDQTGFRLDRFWFRGQQIDARHVTVAEFEGWIRAVEGGGGMGGYPMPVIAVHGLVSGVLLADSSGLAGAARDRLRELPPALQVTSEQAFRNAGPHYLKELRGCVERADGLLFHGLVTEAVRSAFLAWFAAQGLYWPHEKRLGRRLTEIGRSDLAKAQSEIWSAGSLASALGAYQELCRLVERDLGQIDGA